MLSPDEFARFHAMKLARECLTCHNIVYCNEDFRAIVDLCQELGLYSQVIALSRACYMAIVCDADLPESVRRHAEQLLVNLADTREKKNGYL